MNAIIREFGAMTDGDLVLCRPQGVAYQRDMDFERRRYDNSYLPRVQAYEGNAIARAVNAGRVAMLRKHLPERASVLDVGAGTGEFIKAALDADFDAKGFEVIPGARHALELAELYDDSPVAYDAVTMWDSIEHMDDAGAQWLVSMRPGAMLFASIPVFQDLGRVRESKHYRPGEHLYYWTDAGFEILLDAYGFKLIERSAHEISAGRDGIGAFAFRRVT